ncbi:MAG: response regulator [Candidatus Euphemobacter frigidus]|nr:response regulator [Candidatus Euphemobacter frigidus]MDP8276165.1 response regulator [Candidatus Euphemobacter frigidus]
MEAIGKLAGGIAHDFNNILAGIMGYASLLKNRLDQSSPLIAAVEKITKSSQRAAELTTALLAFTRGGIYQPKPLNVNLVIDHLLRVIKETVGRKCDIRENLSPDISSVFTDESQIYQLIMNLCINACEAMTAGGTLTVKSIDAEPDDGFFNDHPGLKKGPYVRVSVSDTGAGIDSETRSRMFDPLFTTKVGRPGAGLGLAMVLGIIERHGGGIEVESEPGRGSTFIVYLPFTWEEDRAAPPTPVETLKGDEIILLVDDEEDFRVSIGIRLKWFGYTVIEAASGEDALKVLEERKKGVDLVLLDMIMPGMDGAEAFEKMRKLIPGLSVIICTGYALDETTQEMLQKGAAAFLQKPFKPDELTVKIRQVLDNR